MPYNKPAPQWNAVGTEPPQSLKDNGWQFNQKPPADYFNWFFYNTAQAIIELQLEALNTDQKGVANGLATLGTDSKLTASQLPAIGSGQITDGSITNTDLATDVKVGSLAALKTANKASVTVAVNEVHDDFDAHNSDTVKHITGPERSKWDGSQLFPFTADTGLPKQTVSNLNTATSPGIYSVSNNGAGAPTTAVGILIVMKRITDNIQQSYWATSSDISYTRTSTDNGVTWSAWKTTETTEGAQAKVDLVQKVKLTQDTGIAKTLPGNSNDLNSVTEPGIYIVDGVALNQPPGYTFGVLIHLVRHSTNYTQIFQQNGSGIIFTRAWISGKWSSWRRAVDDMSFVNTLFGNKFAAQSLANFIGKAAGSTTANPHYAGSRLAVGLGTPLQSWLEFIQSNYNSLVSIDGATITHTTSVNGEQAQQRYSFNVLEHILRTYGTVPGATMAEKVAWANVNIARMAFNWLGNGSSPSGNKATVSVFLNDTGAYAGANIAHTNAGVSKLIYGFTQIINKIDANGFVHFIAYAEPSNGTVASVINTDYAELEVELSTDIKTNLSYSMKPSWIDAVLQNGWIEFSTVSRPQYSQGLDGFVTLKGGIKSGALNTTVMTLPLGFRPVKPSYYLVSGNDTSKSSFRIAVLQDGQVNVLNFSGTSNSDFISLDGIRFPTN